ncbi:DNA polymerase III sliding clamp [Mycobacterium phage Send513]|uniref:DNA polymerase III sliding clamp n=3 Tax=Papyrusvirus send513 TaxID=1982556 RepID=G1BRQ0_9CAUD|nr:DNA polymerase III alpha subunit [Mycobacterium phage Send513]AEK07516.1 DNA polymerase III sliding clamp [Mycobacterium phage Send513]ARW57159.1 DNA polymerase III sliding clamp [Mycobacterium phage Zenon]QCG78177.1 DNA polymerase III sliding clamp [Mycobacterium phage Candle]
MIWVSLHTHSTFSYGDGYGPVGVHVDRVADLGMTALALTEHGNCSSWVQLEKHCKRREIKPIFGLEAYVASENQPRKFHMILLAKDDEGLHNLNCIITESWKTLGTTSKSKFPTVHAPVLRKYNRGIIALSGCADGPISCILLGGKSLGDKRLEPRDGDIQRARRAIERFQAIFGDRYYLETQRFSGLARTRALNPCFEELSNTTGARMAATADVHYPYPNDNEMQRILHAAHRQSTVEVTDANWEYDILLTYPETDREVYRDLVGTGLSTAGAKAAVEATAHIADQCNVELPKAPPPKYVPGERDWEPWT